MKLFTFLSVLAVIVLSASDCSTKKEEAGKKYKGRLEIKGICLNYTIKLIEGNIDTAKIATTWTDESSGKSHTNVFALTDPCSFPASINQGDEFYFVIDTVVPKGCIVCEAYYPIPPRSLQIKVLDKQ
jgi:hypothetical protein